MIQYNISLFFEPSISESAIKALQTVIMPEIAKQSFIEQIHLFEISSHQEPDSNGYSLQCWLPEFEEEQKEFIEGIVSGFFQKEFANQFVYFPSQLKRVASR
jgi:hypothetical protein